MTAPVKGLRADRDARGVKVLVAAVREQAKVAAFAETVPVAAAGRERAGHAPAVVLVPVAVKDAGAVAPRAETAPVVGRVAAASRIRALPIRRNERAVSQGRHEAHKGTTAAMD